MRLQLKALSGKAALVAGFIMLSSTAEAFWVHVDGERTEDTFSMTGGPMGNVWKKPVYDLNIFSKFTGGRGAACTQPYYPLRTGKGFKFWSPTLNNANLLAPFKQAIGCARSPLQEQMLALELMYEKEDELNFLEGSVQFHGLDTEDTIIEYCNTPTDVAFLYHPRYQNLVIWGGAQRPPEFDKPSTVTAPGSLLLILTGLVVLRKFTK